MDSFPLPTTLSIRPEADGKRSSVVIEPLAPGYGTTVGNALRRVLLSSLPGAAVTDVRIQGVDHEFSTVANVKEDIVEIILNLKLLRFRVHSDEPVHLHCRVKGKKPVRARDIEANAQVEIVDLDALIATLTADDGELDMELVVRRGRGYLATESREKEERAIGMLAVDALFSPVRNVSFRIEPVRVGQMTNYERLLLTLETDGSLSCEEAVKAAAKLLLDHFVFVESLGVAAPAGEEIVPEESDGVNEPAA